MKKVNLEMELSKPLEKYLVEKGFEVRCEVNNCDMVAFKDEAYFCIEMKKNLTVDLLCQAVERKTMFDGTFICIPAPMEGITRSKKFKARLKLLKELNLGLFIVYLLKKNNIVENILTPKLKSKNNRKKELMIKEFKGRKGNFNNAGVSKRKIMTSYKQDSLIVLNLLNIKERSSSSYLIKEGAPKKTQSILYKNFYGWFTRVSRGLYEISPEGKQALEDFSDIIEKIIE